jgi:hypothetical protein
MAGETEDVSGLLGDTVAVLRLNARGALIATLVLAGVALASDSSAARGSNAGYGVISFAFQYLLTVSALQKLGLIPDDRPRRRVSATLGLCFVTGLVTLLGFILIVPGLVLLVRWSLSVPILIAEEVGVFEAIRRSWRETRERSWRILGVLLVVYGPLVLAFAAALGMVASGGDPAPGLDIPTALLDVTLAAVSVVAWHAAVAIYAARRTAPNLTEVFA